jgi:hypothetical protein
MRETTSYQRGKNGAEKPQTEGTGREGSKYEEKEQCSILNSFQLKQVEKKEGFRQETNTNSKTKPINA